MVSILLYICFFLLRGSTYLVQAPHWNLVNYRRQMAAYWGFAARVPLAYPHPLPNVGALPLPFTIKLKPNWTLFLVFLSLLLSELLLIYTGLWMFLGPLTGFIGGLIIILPMRFFLPQKIEITQEGLTVRHTFLDWWATAGGGYGKHTIRWNEARLFAVRDGKLGAPATHYELSSPYQVIKWQRIRQMHWSCYRPAIPFAEYDAQMEALIALISGITGLPLYDVRESAPQPQLLVPWTASQNPQ
jgi:hypothetical protein